MVDPMHAPMNGAFPSRDGVKRMTLWIAALKIASLDGEASVKDLRCASLPA